MYSGLRSLTGNFLFAGIIVSFSILCTSVRAQGINGAYAFLNAAANARHAGLGGVNVSLADRDANSFIVNPALVGDTLAGFASVSYQFYIGDIGQANFSWLPELGRLGMVGVGVQHFSYGTIPSFDASGNELGEFSASETAVYLSKQHQIGNYRFGASVKYVASSITGFRSDAMALDLGGAFIHPGKQLTFGIAVRNLGLVLRDYSPASDSRLPLDIQLGATFKPEHMPVRFSLSAYRLMQPSEVTYQGNQPTDAGTLDKVFRHLNFGAELLIHRNVNLLLGYNYGMHQELKLENAGGSAGITYGMAAHIKSVDFVFSRSTYVSGSAAYTFTLAADLKQMIKR